ncbi:MAG: hypothetical protein ACK52W_03905, partial [Alphaproteobacteria bacterium]
MSKQPTTPATIEKASGGDPVEARFQRIETILEKIANRIEAGTDSKQSSTDQNSSISGDVPKSKSLFVLAGVFGVIGLKLVGLIGAKIGAVFDVGGLWKGSKATKSILRDGLLSKEDYLKYFRFTLIGSAIGSVSGAIGGAALGWTRGNRLKEPGDLLKHPIESLNVIFSNKENKTSVIGTSSPQPKITSNRVHEGIQNPKSQVTNKAESIA